MQGKSISGYTLQRPLGTGGMAEVWYAENKIGKKAAVKLLLPKLCQDENVKSRFITEAEVMVKLEHPNIRQVYDYGDIDGRPAIVMEYLDGDDLKSLMKRGKRFTEEELEHWWNQLVDALNYTHQKGIIHRDIKPGNIFVLRDGNIKLLDFGIAKVRESISSTQTGQKLGTLMYMSPEQVKDSKHIDYHTDAYSLAVTYVHLLTGRKPYDSDTSSDFEISEQIVYKPLDLSGLPAKWRGFLTPYLYKEPDKRPELRYFESIASEEKPVMDEDEGTIIDTGEPVLQLNETGLWDSGHETPKPVTPSNPQPKKTTPSETPATLSPKPEDTTPAQPKSKKGLWIGLGIAAAVVLLVLLVKPKKEEPLVIDSDTEAYNACYSVADYRAYLSDYGRNAKHYADAKAFVDQYVADSIAEAQQAIAAAQAMQQADADAQAQLEAEQKEDAAYRKCTTIAACNSYLKAYPDGRYVAEVKAKKAELEEKQREDEYEEEPTKPSVGSETPEQCYDKGDEYYDAKNYTEAAKWYRKAAEQGYADAQCDLGYLYDQGLGVTKNYTEAVKWYRKAAEQGSKTAQCNLGYMYEEGLGVTRNYSEAMKWYRKAADQGYARGEFSVGYLYESGKGVSQDYSEAAYWYRKAADQGYAAAQCNLGLLYDNGDGVPQNYFEAVKWYRKAADNGNVAAQCNLGYMYEMGRGVSKSYTDAVKWYRKAADNGQARGQCNLGYMYEEGLGVTQSFTEAVKWYRKAAEQGYARAQCNLGYMYSKGRGVAQSDAEAVKWYRKAANQGHDRAQYNLALKYYYGEGVAQDKAEAKKWFQKAAAQGYEDAIENLETMF